MLLETLLCMLVLKSSGVPTSVLPNSKKAIFTWLFIDYHVQFLDLNDVKYYDIIK